MSKVKELCCYDCALRDVDATLGDRFPVYLRGIATAKKVGVTLPNFSEAGNDVVISEIDSIVEQGTELLLDAQGVPIDRPADFTGDGILTRVGLYAGNARSFEMMFVRNAFRNLGRVVQDMPRGHEVIPALLVYDSSIVKRVKSVEIALPVDPGLRRESLLQVYLLSRQFSS